MLWRIPRLWGLGGFGVVLRASRWGQLSCEGERRGLSHHTQGLKVLLAIKQQNPFSEQFVAINSHSQE